MLRRLTAVFGAFVVAFSFLTFSGIASADSSVKTPAQLFYPQVNTVAGNPNGKITIVEFFDYNCGYCHEVPAILSKISRSNPDVRIVYRDLPVLGPESTFAARAAVAAGQQGKYVALHNAIFNARGPLTDGYVMSIANSVGVDTSSLRQELSDRAVSSQLRANQADANMLGIDGVPVVVIGQTPAKGDRSANAYVYVAPTYGDIQGAINMINRG